MRRTLEMGFYNVLNVTAVGGWQIVTGLLLLPLANPHIKLGKVVAAIAATIHHVLMNAVAAPQTNRTAYLTRRVEARWDPPSVVMTHAQTVLSKVRFVVGLITQYASLMLDAFSRNSSCILD